MPMLSVSIMAHESRKDFFPALQVELGDVPILVDKAGEGNIGIWENCKRAWRARPGNAEYHVVIQDDGIPCRNFLQAAEAEIRKARLVTGTDPAISFFFGNRKSMKPIGAKGMMKGHVILKKLRWGVAICLPEKVIDAMIKFGDGMHIRQDDARIARFLESRNIPIYFPMPSLVDHRHGKSLVGDPGMKRSAYSFIDREVI